MIPGFISINAGLVTERRCSFNYNTDLSAYSLWRSMLVFDNGGLVWAILTGGRWASALAGRTGTWLSIPKLSAAAVLWSHGLAAFYTQTKTPLLFCSWQKTTWGNMWPTNNGGRLLCALDTRVWLAGSFFNTGFFIRGPTTQLGKAALFQLWLVWRTIQFNQDMYENKSLGSWVESIFNRCCNSPLGERTWHELSVPAEQGSGSLGACVGNTVHYF